MNLHFIEAHDATDFNWGKFAVGRFTSEECAHPSAVDPLRSLIMGRGWTQNHVFVMDLQTGEGAMFKLGGSVVYDLDKHKIWVCPMFEPFLEWLYKQDLSDLSSLPSVVNLGDVPVSMAGYRRPGPVETPPEFPGDEE